MAKYISNKTHNQKDQTDHQLTPQKSSYSQPYSKYTKTYPTEHLNSSSKTNSHTPPTFPQSSIGKKKIVLGVAVGKAYSDELKLLWSMLDRAEFKAQHFVADGYYDSVRLIKHFEQRQIKCVTPISERTRQEVRNRYRKLVKERYEDERYYRRICGRSRYEVEQLFGNVRRACGDRDNTRLYELASVFVLVRFIFWNHMTLLKLSFLCFSTCGIELLSYAYKIILKHSRLLLSSVLLRVKLVNMDKKL
ncbi:MAG: transposase [Aquificaceae bacterium]|nr:transposase [Aquificaceae bacterium]